MIRRVYLIARREYLSYVATWGFWISLSLAPLFIAAGLIVPAMLERASPVRHIAIIADDPALIAAIDAELAARERLLGRAALLAMLRAHGELEARGRALDAFEATPGDLRGALVAGLEAAGLDDQVDAAAIEIEPAKIVRVEPPARDPEALRPFLLGESLIVTPAGPRPLDAAAVLRRDPSGVIAADLWSANLSFAGGELRDLVGGAARDLMRREELAAAGVAPEAVIRLESLAPQITELTPEREGSSAQVTLADRLPYAIGAGLSVALWMVIFSVVNMLLTSTIEEKSNKILDMLLASARLHEILFGKLLGVAAVSFTLMSAWAVAGAGTLALSARLGAAPPAELVAALADPGLLIPFAGYFIAGYLMYGAIFVAIGSLCETLQEAQTLMSPILFILIAPMFVMPLALRDPDSGVLAVLSWVPLYTPFLMMLRLPAGPPLIEVILTTGLLAATTALVLWAASGVFRAGVVGRVGPGRITEALGLKRRAR